MSLIHRLATYIKDSPYLKLWACLVVDFIGFASFFVPFIGESVDVFWAPVSAFFLHFMFGTFLIPMIGLLEELVPGTDFIPTATIAFSIEHIEFCAPLRRFLGMSRARDR